MRQILSILISIFIITITNSNNIKQNVTLTVSIQRTSQTLNIKLIPGFISSIKGSQSLIIHLQKADPINACRRILKETQYLRQYSSFLLVNGDDCSFSQKIFQSKRVLAAGVIIISDKSSQFKKQLFGMDNPFYIFFMTKQNAKQLLQQNDSKFRGRIIMKTESQKKDKNFKQVDIWVSSFNNQSYQLMKWWSQILVELPTIKQKMKWQPHYAFTKCNNFDSLCNCTCSGDFCSPQIYPGSNALVKEDIRQILVFKQNQQLYLKYMIQFREKCFENYLLNYHSDQCSISILQNLKNLKSFQIQTQATKFIQNCSSRDLYGSMQQDQIQYDNSYINYPALLVDRLQLPLNNKHELRYALCQSLNMAASRECAEKVVQTQHTIITVFNVLMFIFIIFALSFIALGLLWYYQKKVKRQMGKEIKMQVSTAVDHYYSILQEK